MSLVMASWLGSVGVAGSLCDMFSALSLQNIVVADAGIGFVVVDIGVEVVDVAASASVAAAVALVAHGAGDDIMHHLATARLVAWAAWKLSEQRAAKQPHQRRSRYRTLQEHMPRLHHALLRFACMHFPLLCYKAHNTLFAHTHSQIVR